MVKIVQQHSFPLTEREVIRQITKLKYFVIKWILLQFSHVAAKVKMSPSYALAQHPDCKLTSC